MTHKSRNEFEISPVRGLYERFMKAEKLNGIANYAREYVKSGNYLALKRLHEANVSSNTHNLPVEVFYQRETKIIEFKNYIKDTLKQVYFSKNLERVEAFKQIINERNKLQEMDNDIKIENSTLNNLICTYDREIRERNSNVHQLKIKKNPRNSEIVFKKNLEGKIAA